MTVAGAINSWLVATRDMFDKGPDQRDAVGRAIDNFMTSKGLGRELDEYLKQDVLIRKLRAAEVPTEELIREIQRVYVDRATAVRAGDLESCIAEMVIQDGSVGTLNAFGNLLAAYQKPPRRFIVDYEVRGGSEQTVCGEGTRTVMARTRYEAECLTCEWVEANDPAHDDRVDPYIVLTRVADSEDDTDEDDDDGEEEED